MEEDQPKVAEVSNQRAGSSSPLRGPAGSPARDPSSGPPVPAEEDNTRWYKLTPSCVLGLTGPQGDLTKWFIDGRADAIVNAANERMLGGGGVDGAIHRAAGRELYLACKEVPEVRGGVRCPTGDARLTRGFRLPAGSVIHTVGPVYRNATKSAPLLEKAYISSLKLADESGLKYIAFPAISCGVYGYPYDEAADVAVKACKENTGSLKEVHFVLFERPAWDAWVEAAERLLEPAPECEGSQHNKRARAGSSPSWNPDEDRIGQPDPAGYMSDDDIPKPEEEKAGLRVGEESWGDQGAEKEGGGQVLQLSGRGLGFDLNEGAPSEEESGRGVETVGGGGEAETVESVGKKSRPEEKS